MQGAFFLNNFILLFHVWGGGDRAPKMNENMYVSAKIYGYYALSFP